MLWVSGWVLVVASQIVHIPSSNPSHTYLLLDLANVFYPCPNNLRLQMKSVHKDKYFQAIYIQLFKTHTHIFLSVIIFSP